MKNIIIVAAILVLTGCASFSHRTGYWLSEPEVRVYADRGVMLPSGGRGGAVQIYGVRVKHDGSEVVVWKHFMWEWSGLIFDHRYDIIMSDTQDSVYLRFKEHKPNTFFKFDRNSGRLLETVDSASSVYADLEFRRPEPRTMFNRPDPVTGMQNQMMGPVGPEHAELLADFMKKVAGETPCPPPSGEGINAVPEE